ncbi:MAG: hypothetical protein KF897_14330 [Opitutaceae bacterium]|nr:hypothetical protein [Opitutaceae bacterium]
MLAPNEQRAAFAILLHAALADGANSDSERAALRRMTESFSPGDGASFNPWSIYQEVLGGRYPLEAAARDLSRPEARILAYEMAAGVCDTDGPPNAAEREFLQRLHGLWQLSGGPTATEAAAAPLAAAVPAATPAGSTAAAVPAPRLTPVDAAALEKSILNYAILNAALELLPQSLGTMAIVPLQMKMVYGVGKAHGYALDRGHIRDFLATAGAGLAAQAVEGYARKLLGGVVGGLLGGGMLGGLGRAAVGTATGAGITFAATYAIGHLALRYYGGGRRMETAVLKDTYQRLLEDGRRLFSTHQGDIQRRAATLNPAEVINLVRQT